MITSTPSSAAAAATHLDSSTGSSSTPPAVSRVTGLRSGTLGASGGTSLSSAALVAADGTARLSPASASASAASTESPPPSVSTMTRPALRGTEVTSARVSTRSEVEATRTAPASSSTACQSRSSAASAPVWVATARAEPADRPDLRMTTGLPAAAQAARPARRLMPEPRRPSAYTAMAAVALSAAK